MFNQASKSLDKNRRTRSITWLLVCILFACPQIQGHSPVPEKKTSITHHKDAEITNQDPKVQADRALLERIYQYASRTDTNANPHDTSYAYTKFYLRIHRKNPTLMLVPSVYAIAHRNEREFVGETYNILYRKGKHHYESKNLINLTTVPHQRSTFDVMLRYLTPKIYSETIIDNTIISPFHAANHRFYKYQMSQSANGKTLLTITPKRKNTQLVIGTAIVDTQSGRIVSCDLTGEYDMTNFQMHIDMGKGDAAPLIPSRCEVDIRFMFLQSKVTGKYMARYGLTNTLQADTTLTKYEKLCQIRPEPLNKNEQAVYDKLLEQQRVKDSIRTSSANNENEKKKRNFGKDVLWDVVGDNVFNRVRTHFGLNNQGYIRLNPVLNPLYMGYDNRRGFTYKFDIRASYQFSQNSELSLRLNAGYAFKQHQFYFRLPVYYYFNKRRNGYLKLEWNNGNHIQNASVRRKIEQANPDSTLYDYGRLNEFKQTEVRAIVNYDLSDKWSIQLGSLFQRKSAVHKSDFDKFAWEKKYISFAPVVEIQYRPIGWNGPILSLDYDRGIKGFAKANTGYERWELNADYVYQVNQLQSWKMRLGTGFYTNKDRDAYFLNYENFRENNLPGGWNDDTNGEFELLRGDTYNMSEYYVRANLTYESPLLLLSWIPWVGRYVEMERVYVSALDVKRAHPYVEVGYGLTCRLMSLGLFVSNGRGNRAIGATFGFELFRHW